MITVIANLKGGTGKSTVAFNLAIWLISTGRRVTVVDLDPQKSLTDAAVLRGEEGIVPRVPVETGTFSEVRLPENAEEIIIDVGTADLGSFKQALMIADRILIPVTPSQADIWSTQRFVEFLYKNTHGNPAEALTFLNRSDTSREIHASDEAAAALQTLPGVRHLPQRLSNRMGFRDSFSEGLSVMELEPRSIASREFKALAEHLYGTGYRSILDRLKKQKASAAMDPAFHAALETPSARAGAHTGDTTAPAVASVEAARTEKGRKSTGGKRHKRKESRKRSKTRKEKQAAEVGSVKDRKKSKKGQREKKRKKPKK
ncbi:MAG: AAA family ATPase [Gammaproteobacteria bacterium]|nr:AAA family ATPase [Gammaproteobacteria bacterium]